MKQEYYESNSSYGSSYSVNLIKSRYLETINEKRSKKIKKLLDGI